MTVGEMLRDARESRGITLAQAERETKIRQKYLAALEDDNIAALPGPLYARGFLRNYALYLGLDPDEVIYTYDAQSTPTRSRIRAARGEPVKKPDPAAGDKISIQPLSPKPLDRRVRYGSSYVAISLLAIPLIIAFYFVYSAYAGRKGEVPLPTASPRPPTPLSVMPSATLPLPPTASPITVSANVSGTATVGLTPVADVTVVTGSGTPVVIPKGDTVTLKITTVRDAWMQITVDGVQQYNGTVAKGTTKQWTGNSTVRIRTGRADSVKIAVNGADLGLLGDRTHLIVEEEWNTAGEQRIIER